MSLFRLGWVTVVLAGVAAGQNVERNPARGSMLEGRTAYPAPQTTSTAVLEEMSSRAAVIFAGTVTAVRLPEDPGGIVEVEFAISSAVRGAAGAVYVVREWAGLWRDGARYRVGDRRLMLLHAPGPGGLSSPVDGLDGAIPVAPHGTQADAATSADGTGESVDLRWLQAKTLQTAGYTTGSEVRALTVAAPAAAEDETKPALGKVVGMLMDWEARRNAGR